MVRGIDITPDNFRETVLGIRKDFIIRYEALKKQFDAELESYRQDPTQNISEIVRSQLKRLGGLVDRTAGDYGSCLDIVGYKRSSQVYKATLSLVDELNAEGNYSVAIEKHEKYDI